MGKTSAIQRPIFMREIKEEINREKIMFRKQKTQYYSDINSTKNNLWIDTILNKTPGSSSAKTNALTIKLHGNKEYIK